LRYDEFEAQGVQDHAYDFLKPVNKSMVGRLVIELEPEVLLSTLIKEEPKNTAISP
jgi:hypothetical protein